MKKRFWKSRCDLGMFEILVHMLIYTFLSRGTSFVIRSTLNRSSFSTWKMADTFVKDIQISIETSLGKKLGDAKIGGSFGSGGGGCSTGEITLVRRELS